MGYDLHITRKSDWCEEEGPTILREEVVVIIERNDDLRVVEDLTNDTELTFAWTGSQQEDWVMHILEEGELKSKNPSEGLVKRMWKIAQELDARLQGDDGEIYGEDGEGRYSDDEDEPSPSKGQMPAPKSGFFARLFGKQT